MRPVTNLQRKVAPFEVISDYVPAGDQPAAIEEIARRINAGEQDVVLLGATGTGKSATTALLIERLQRPTLVLAPNKFRLDGRLEVDYLNDRYELNLPESERFTTLGGMITDLAGKLPEPGDSVVVGPWRLEVEGMEVQRVKQVLVRLDA